MREKPERGRTFAEALGAILDGRPTTAAPLAVAMRTSKAQVDAWLEARDEPSPADVFAIEKVLDLAPGVLSRELGFLPVGIAGDQAVEDAISGSPAVGADGKQLVLGLWCTLVAQHAARRRAQALAESSFENQTVTPLAFSIASTAGLLGVSTRTVSRMIEDGRIRTVRHAHRVIVPLAAIDAFLAEAT